MADLLIKTLKARLSYFTVKLVIITNEFAILVEVTRLSCDDLVIIALSRLYFRTPSQFSSTLLCSQPFLVTLGGKLTMPYSGSVGRNHKRFYLLANKIYFDLREKKAKKDNGLKSLKYPTVTCNLYSVLITNSRAQFFHL